MNPIGLDENQDAQLLKEVMEGRSKSFDILYEKYWEYAYENAYKRLKDHEQSKDIVQEIFTHIWVKRHTLVIESLPAYLFISVRNRVFKVVAKQKLQHPFFNYLESLPATSLQPDANLLWKEFFHSYEMLLKTLPAKKQLIFRLRFQENLSTSDISARLGLSRKTVQNQLGRAVEHIRSSLFILLRLSIGLISILLN